MITKAILLTAMVTLGACAHASESPDRAPDLRTSESIEYIARKNDPLIGLIKSDTFRGVALRSKSKIESLKMIDDHVVVGTDAKKIDEEVCRKSVTRVLGSDQGADAAIKINKIEIFQSKSGDACEVQAADAKNPEGLLKRYRLVMGLYRGDIRVLLAQDKSPVAREGESPELRAFLQSLK